MLFRWFLRAVRASISSGSELGSGVESGVSTNEIFTDTDWFIFAESDLYSHLETVIGGTGNYTEPGKLFRELHLNILAFFELWKLDLQFGFVDSFHFFLETFKLYAMFKTYWVIFYWVDITLDAILVDFVSAQFV